jgi:dihydrofolate reductase
MRSITVTIWITLDGVVQGPGRPDEDDRGGFAHGGWGQRYNDEVMGREMAKDMAKPGDLLFGRRTWQDFITAWARRADGNPFTTPMNAATKYVVSRTLEDADAWQNSILLRGDAVDTVDELKAQSGTDLSIIGSASLVRTLHTAGLIDRYTLLICPLTLGSGTQLFDGPAPLTEFELTSSVATTKGVIIALQPPVREHTAQVAARDVAQEPPRATQHTSGDLVCRIVGSKLSDQGRTSAAEEIEQGIGQ